MQTVASLVLAYNVVPSLFWLMQLLFTVAYFQPFQPLIEDQSHKDCNLKYEIANTFIMQ